MYSSCSLRVSGCHMRFTVRCRASEIYDAMFGGLVKAVSSDFEFRTFIQIHLKYSILDFSFSNQSTGRNY